MDLRIAFLSLAVVLQRIISNSNHGVSQYLALHGLYRNDEEQQHMKPGFIKRFSFMLSGLFFVSYSSAQVQASSTHKDYHANAVVDGVVDGYPDNIHHEWASISSAY